MHETPQAIRTILSQWECLAFIAYDYYVRFGRIILGISLDDDDSDHPTFMAILCSQANQEIDPSITSMLTSFDPEREILIQFEDDYGNLRTQRLRTNGNSCTPKTIYAQKMVDRYEQNPLSVDLNLLPDWLRRILSAHPPARYH